MVQRLKGKLESLVDRLQRYKVNRGHFSEVEREAGLHPPSQFLHLDRQLCTI